MQGHLDEAWEERAQLLQPHQETFPGRHKNQVVQKSYRCCCAGQGEVVWAIKSVSSSWAFKGNAGVCGCPHPWDAARACLWDAPFSVARKEGERSGESCVGMLPMFDILMFWYFLIFGVIPIFSGLKGQGEMQSLPRP